MDFGSEDLSKWCREGMYEEFSMKEAMGLLRNRKMICLGFVVWQGDYGKRKGRFAVNFSEQSKSRAKCSVKLEFRTGFALELKKGDRLMSFDTKGWFIHFYLRPERRDFF